MKTNTLISPFHRIITRTSIPHNSNLHCRPNKFLIRTMASSPEKFEWLVVVPDKEGSLEKRLAVRPKHLEGLKPALESGFWKMGGAFLNSIPEPDKTPAFAGSAMIAYASTKEEVLSAIKNDIYAKEGVWDLEKMTVFPFKAAFREPLN